MPIEYSFESFNFVEIHVLQRIFSDVVIQDTEFHLCEAKNLLNMG